MANDSWWLGLGMTSTGLDVDHYSLNDIFDPVGSRSRGGDVRVCVKDIDQPSLPTPFYSVFVSISVFMAFQLYFIP